MPDKVALQKAIDVLVETYTQKILQFDTAEFLRTGVDPFRFTFNVSVWGITRAIEKEVEHKLEMGLENAVGAFHEGYLGNATRHPKGTKWRRVPPGDIPGVDIANEQESIYLQVKSKHNSMNAASSARLAQELRHLKQMKPNATVGCAWVIATRNKACIGQGLVKEVGKILKGKEVYDYVTGLKGEMDAVLALLPYAIEAAARKVDVVECLKQAAQSIERELRRRAGKSNDAIIRYVCSQSVD